MSAETKKSIVGEDISGLSRAQRGVVIISLLDESLAKRVLSTLEQPDIERVESLMASIPMVPRQELYAIIADFLTELQKIAGGVVGGRAMLEQFRRSVLASMEQDASVADQPGRLPEIGPADSAWVQLQTLDATEVADYLSALPANLIASALRRVEPAFSAEVITRLDETRSGPALSELISQFNGDPDIDLLVEKMVREDLIGVREDKDEVDIEDQFGQVGEIMSLLPAAKREKLIAFLQEQQSEHFESVQRQVLDVARLPDILPTKFVPVLTREFDEAQFLRILSVFKADFPDVFEFLIQNISSRMATKIRDELERQPHVNDDADEILNAFTVRLLALKRDQIIELSG